jgi:hypothetical protein
MLIELSSSFLCFLHYKVLIIKKYLGGLKLSYKQQKFSHEQKFAVKYNVFPSQKKGI